ncbi:deaminase [Kutzneria sp. CA-103260]|uniref:deaminase n=1 Tax=Kutzneria sp. CA-103260 TaxID=2802641 RepID=UPI001BA6E856|nr:deaminase [Kutzneria sp. CA-103260]QUQ71034.1 cytidine and deoxycytidylate deaminase [Kutzneria sp. CA-103260]
MTSDEMVWAAMEVAEEGIRQGELPIGAVVFAGDEVVGRAFTRDSVGRLKHADLLAMIEADGQQVKGSLRLAVNLEPCLMCLGAAMSLGVREICYGLSSPGDGAARIAASWEPGAGMGWYRAPEMHGGIRAEEVREQFRRYCERAADTPLRKWANTLASGT